MSSSLYGELYRKYKWQLLITVPMSLLLATASMLVIAIINDAVSNGLDSLDFGLELFFVAISVLFVIGVLTELIRARLIANVTYDIQIKMVSRVMKTPFVQLERIGFSKVLATLTEDMNTAVNFFHILPLLFINVSMFVVGLLYLAYLSLPLLMVVLAFILFGGLTIGTLLWMTKKDRVGIREAIDRMMKHYQNVVSGAKELSLHTPRRIFVKQLIVHTAHDMRLRTKRILSLVLFVDQWGQLVVFAMLGCIIFVVSSYIPLSTEIIVGYVLTLLFLLDPIEVIVESIDELLDAKVAFNKIDSLELAHAGDWDNLDEKYQPVQLSNNSAKHQLILKDVEYSYGEKGKGELNKTFTLGPISTHFNAGEATFIIGGNGSGKSTLVKIISGLYHADKGAVTFDNVEVTEENIKHYRNYFSMVTPDFCLFEDVLDGQGERCDDGKIGFLLNKLKLTSVVSSNESRLSNLDLSHGQRKRLALMQVYLENKPIILLDEWAADQDPVFKKIFYYEIIPELKRQGKIIIVISHDEQYYYDTADRLLKVSEGQLVEVNLEEHPGANPTLVST